MFKPFFALLLSIFVIAACDSGDTLSTAASQFEITVVENDSTVATGEISFVPPVVGSNTTGTYSLTTPSGGPLLPMTSTSGSLTASMTTGGKIQINITEPNMSDTGLRFDFDFSASGFSGTWGDITFVGYTERGTFTADAI